MCTKTCLKNKLLSKRNQDLGIWKILHITENEKTYSNDNTKRVTEHPFDEKILGASRGQQKQGTERIMPAEFLPVCTNGAEKLNE